MTEYKCVNGHDLCCTTMAGPECPYCEKCEVKDKEEKPGGGGTGPYYKNKL